MPESKSHKRAKKRAAGKTGKTEVPLKGGGRLDAQTKGRATEVERSGDRKRLKRAARRLMRSRKRQKVLQVPNQDMGKATAAMREVGVGGTVKNMSGTKRRHVSLKTKKKGR